MDKPSSGILHGIKAIAEHLGLTDRQAKHLAAKHGLPTFKLGKTVCSRRSDVDAWFASKAAASRNAIESAATA